MPVIIEAKDERFSVWAVDMYGNKLYKYPQLVVSTREEADAVLTAAQLLDVDAAKIIALSYESPNPSIKSKYLNHTFTLRDINNELEKSGACLMLNVDSKDGTLESVELLTADGFPAQVTRLPGFNKPKVERFNDPD